MRRGARIAAIIPARDEEPAIGRVLATLPGWLDERIVVDNGSRDATAAIAAAAGARVIHEPRRGYGAACLAGPAALGAVDVIVFLDGDFSDDAREMAGLVNPILEGRVRLVIGSRTRGLCDPRALTAAQRFGNALACGLIRWFWGVRFTDLGPFRAIDARALADLGLANTGFGWTIEMQVKAARRGLRMAEIPVSYRRRVGRSKISGTFSGSVRAGLAILLCIAHARLASGAGAPPAGAR